MERIPPHNDEAEKSVLGAILLSQDALDEATEIIAGEHFYSNKHKEIFEAAMELQRKNEPVDYITICDELKKRNCLDLVGGRGYIVSLGEEVPYIGNVKTYAQKILETAELRNLISTASEIIEQGFTPGAEAESVLSYAEREIFSISQKKGSSNMAEIKEIMQINLAQIDERAKMGNELNGISSGLLDLDKLTTGFQKSDMIVLAARPSMGKTAFALNVANDAAQKGRSVMIFSLEMPKEQLGMRFLAMESRIDSQKLREAKLKVDEWSKVYFAINEISKGNLVIDDTSTINISSIKSKCRKRKAEHGLDLIIIDYLQLLENNGRPETRLQEITAFSRGVKQVAREMNCPVIVLSQLSRGPESRPDSRPRLSDLRDSGAIEQDADQVLFLYRDEVYNTETEDRGICEVIVAKNRNGEIGTARVKWDAAHMRFANLLHGGM